MAAIAQAGRAAGLERTAEALNCRPGQIEYRVHFSGRGRRARCRPPVFRSRMPPKTGFLRLWRRLLLTSAPTWKTIRPTGDRHGCEKWYEVVRALANRRLAVRLDGLPDSGGLHRGLRRFSLSRGRLSPAGRRACKSHRPCSPQHWAPGTGPRFSMPRRASKGLRRMRRPGMSKRRRKNSPARSAVPLA